MTQRFFFWLTLLVLAISGTAQAIDMKVDRVTVNTPIGGATATWSTVTFATPFGGVPVVVATATDSNGDPATVRVRNITTAGFEIGVVEAPPSDGATSAMTVDYFAAEPGVYNFPGSVRMAVGRYSTTTFQANPATGAGWDNVSFGNTFPSAPAVMAMVQSINSQPTLDAGDVGTPFLSVAIENVTTTGARMALERAETTTGTLVAEDIGYIAMASGTSFSLSGATVGATLTPANVQGWDNGCFTRNFASAFGATPLVVASMNTRNGNNGGWGRICSKSASAVGLLVDEDQALDSERSHIGEAFGVLAVSGAFQGTRNGRDIAAGTVTIAATVDPVQWTRVDFSNPFNTTPHVFALATDQGSAPAALRMRNVGINGFDIAAFQPTGGIGIHPEMTVDYVAIIPGEHTLPNGDVFQVGSVTTNRYRSGAGGGSTGDETLTWPSANSGGSALLLDIQGNNNEASLDPNAISVPWLTATALSVGNSTATVTLERSEANAGSVSAGEVLAYFVAPNGANDQLTALDGGVVDYEMQLTPRNIAGTDNGCFTNSFFDTVASPFVIAAKSSRNGGDGGWMRRCSVSTSSVGLVVDEDTANDTERAHTTEQASIFVFSRAFEAEFNQVDHYAIFHAGRGVTCEAERVIIAAHDAGDIGVEAGGRSVTVSLSSVTPGWNPSDASWSLATGAGTFSTPSAGTARYTFATGESSVELFLDNTSAATLDIDVIDDDPAFRDQDGVAEDPQLIFDGSGLRFYNDADGDGDADGSDPIASPLTSGQASGNLILRAVETNSATGACESRVSGSQTVNLAYECVNPSFCFRAGDATVNTQAIQENDNGASISYTPITLNFDAEGEASFNLNFFDAGAIRLHAELNLPASGSDPAVTLNGTSDNTIFRPADLVVTTVTRPDGSANPGSTTTGAGFVAADSSFRVIVEARNAVGGTTPNFGAESPSEGLVLSPVTLILPSAGDLPPLVNADSFVGAGTEGAYLNDSVRWPEVGTLSLRAEIRDGDYLGTGNVIGSDSANIGRFFPDHLDLTTGSVTPGCSSGFTYLSDAALTYRPVDLRYTVEALTAGGTRLANYDDNFPTAAINIVAENADDGTNLAARLGVPTATWSDGSLTVSGTDNAGMARLSTGGNEQPDGPFAALQLGLRAAGSDPDTANFLVADRNMNAGTAGDCVSSSTCDAVALGNAQIFRFGRLVIENAHGPESASLAMPFRVEVWDPSAGFTLHVSDSCTQIAMSDIEFDSQPLSIDSNRSVALGSGSTTGSFSVFTPGDRMVFSAGSAGLEFSAPGLGNTGAFFVDIDLSNHPWLRSDWNNNGNAADDTVLPSAELRFGRYRGHDRVIFWREVLD